MAHSVSSSKVIFKDGQSENSSGTLDTNGSLVCCELNITSYTNGGEVINAGTLGLNKVYGAQLDSTESAEYEVHAVVIAAGNKSLTLTVDNVGTGTETTNATDIGTFSVLAWGEALGSGSNV